MPTLLELPHFIPPMLAKAGEAFDSDEYLFEIKWDGTRALAFVDRPGHHRLMNRRRVDMTRRYPDLACLGDLPPGTVLDGEIVVLTNGKPDFAALQSREHARNPTYIKGLSRSKPVTFIAFDQLLDRFEPIMERPLSERREILARTVAECGSSRVILSQGVVGPGKAYFQAACNEGLEGIMAKRLASRYAPGQRTGAWIKIKRQQVALCAVIGFLPEEGRQDFRSLLLACEQGGKAIYVGRVGSGFDAALRAKLNELLWPRVIDQPVIPCRAKAIWVRPDVYCHIRYMEQTASGQLRSPVFLEICHGH